MQMTKTYTDDSMMELVRHGTDSFPFAYYHEDIRLFDESLIDWHWHREIEFVTVAQGNVSCLIGNMKIPLKQGDGIFINTGVIHRFEAPVEGIIPNVLFAPEFLSPLGSRMHDKYISPILISGISHARFSKDTPWQVETLQKLAAVYHFCEEKAETWEMHVHALLQEIWAALYAHKAECTLIETTGNSLLSQARLKQMVQFIEQAYAQKVTLEDIAKAADISKSEALRCFQAGLRSTPIAYLNSVRLIKARELLLRTNLSITDIAHSAGFESASYFDRLFKRAYAVTPRSMRKKAV